MKAKPTPHFVVGHKNPDSDTVVCAHVLAWLHRQIDADSQAQAIMLGEANRQSAWLFEQAGSELPVIRESCLYQAGEIMTSVPTATPETPLREALETMQRARSEFVAVIDEDRRPIGVISDRTQRTNYLLQCNIEDFIGTLLEFEHLVTGLPLEQISEQGAADISGIHAPMHRPDTQDEWDSHTAIIIGDRQLFLERIKESPPGAVILTEVESGRAQELAKQINCPVYRYSGSVISMLTRLPGCFPSSAALVEEYEVVDEQASEREINRSLRKSQWGLLVVDQDRRVSGSICPMDFLNLERPKISLVDHSERGQSIEGIQDGVVIEIIDHHRLGDIETIQPLHIDVRPLGSTASILHDRIKDEGLTAPVSIAKLLLGALISDTLLLTSPTCTKSDERRAEELAKLAQVDLRAYGIEVLRQNDELTTASPEKLVRRDCKSFTYEGITFLAAQIETVDLSALSNDREQAIESAFAAAVHATGVAFGAVMLTDVLASKSLLMIVSEDSKWRFAHVPEAVQQSGERWIEESFVSRKKQLIPLLLHNIKKALEE